MFVDALGGLGTKILACCSNFCVAKGCGCLTGAKEQVGGVDPCNNPYRTPMYIYIYIHPYYSLKRVKRHGAALEISCKTTLRQVPPPRPDTHTLNPFSGHTSLLLSFPPVSEPTTIGFRVRVKGFRNSKEHGNYYNGLFVVWGLGFRVGHTHTHSAPRAAGHEAGSLDNHAPKFWSLRDPPREPTISDLL